MSTVLVIIARMGSTRLPGKVLMPLGGKPVLQWVIEAAQSCKLVDKVIVATTTSQQDDELEKWVGYQEPHNSKLWHFRGSEDDVLERFYLATAGLKPWDVVVRVTGDCPFVDPHVIDEVIALREVTKTEYASN